MTRHAYSLPHEQASGYHSVNAGQIARAVVVQCKRGNRYYTTGLEATVFHTTLHLTVTLDAYLLK